VTRGGMAYERSLEMGSGGIDEWEMGSEFLLGRWEEAWHWWARSNKALLSGTRRVWRGVRPLAGRPSWDGNPFSGRLLLDLEHGQGQSFMMLRWVPMVRERVGMLTIRTRPELMRMIADQWPDVEIVSRKEDPGEFDRCVLSYSLPHVLQASRPEQLPPAPYLWSLRTFRRLPGDFRVGIRWAGLPVHHHDLSRSTSLVDWRPVLKCQA
jgi:hypothetical protein